MMLPSDLLLVTDKKFAKYTKQYAKDNAKFFKDFAAAFQKYGVDDVGAVAKSIIEWVMLKGGTDLSGINFGRSSPSTRRCPRNLTHWLI